MAELHPIIVHFTVALTVVGVLLRLVSLTGRVAFAGPAAALLILLAAATSVASVKSGEDAHGPVERVPGARAAVVEHEEWGERARNVLLVVAALELVALALRRNPRVRVVQGASAAFGLMALFMVYEAGEHGGQLVHASAGGVGLLSVINATAVYRLTDHWGLRAGYNFYWLTNAALAPNQYDFATVAGAGTGINDNGGIFLHGANLGTEYRW